MKIKVLRKVEGWIEEFFDVDNLNDETIKDVLEYYDIYPYDSEFLYDGSEELGPYQIYDDEENLIQEGE